MARLLGFLIVTLGLLLHWSQAGYEHYCDPRAPPEPKRGTCGPALPIMISVACRIGSFRDVRENVSQLKKRGSIASLLKTRAKRGIRPRGIVCECCVHQCTTREARQYC